MRLSKVQLAFWATTALCIYCTTLGNASETDMSREAESVLEKSVASERVVSEDYASGLQDTTLYGLEK